MAIPIIGLVFTTLWMIGEGLSWTGVIVGGLCLAAAFGMANEERK